MNTNGGIPVTNVLKAAESDVADPSLSGDGQRLIDWAAREMPVLRIIRERFRDRAPSRGTAYRCVPACHQRDGQPGDHAQSRRRACDALREQSAVHPGPRSQLRSRGIYGIPTFAVKGEDSASYYSHIQSVLDTQPADHDG